MPGDLRGFSTNVFAIFGFVQQLTVVFFLDSVHNSVYIYLKEKKEKEPLQNIIFTS